MTNAEIISAVLVDEGGDKFTCRPDDPGGATKWGVTIPALSDFWTATGRRATPGATDIMALTEADARAFYQWLMDDCGVGKIVNDMLRWIVFDAVVHVGRKPAIRLLQRALGINDDGVIGPVTLAATPHLDALKLCRLVCTEQMLFYSRLAHNNLTDADKDGIPDQLEFLPGYSERLARKMRAVA